MALLAPDGSQGGLKSTVQGDGISVEHRGSAGTSTAHPHAADLKDKRVERLTLQAAV
jgi:hypothetical protein